MILTAQDIQSQQFNVRFRGFDVEEVDNFLGKIAAAFQAVYDENQKLKDRLEALEKELGTYQNQQKSFQSAIIAAQNVADGMKEKSREEAAAIVAEAMEEARLRREDTDRQIGELKRKIDGLKTLREQAKNELVQQLQSYLHMLEPEAADGELTDERDGLAGRKEPPRSSSYAATSRRRAMVEPESERPGQGISLAASEEEDLADLYVKIDIPDGGLPLSISASQDIAELSSLPAQTDKRVYETSRLMPLGYMFGMDENEDAGPVLPDFEGDLTFNLEDPLAESHGPAVSFTDRLKNASKKETDRLNSGESPR